MERRKRSKSKDKLSAGTDEGRQSVSNSYSDKVGITAPPPDSTTDVTHYVKKSYELSATTSGPKHQPKSKHQSNHQQTSPTDELKGAGINTLYSNGAPLGISQPMLQAAAICAGSSGCGLPVAYNPCQMPTSGPNTMVGGLMGLNNNNCGQFRPNLFGPMGVCGPQIMSMGASNPGQLGIDMMTGSLNYNHGPQASLNMTQGTVSMSAPGPQASANMAAQSIGCNGLSSMQQNGTLESEAMLRCLTGLLKSLIPQPKSQVTCTKQIYVGIPCNADRKCIKKFLSHSRNIGQNQLCCRPAAPPPPCCDPCKSNPRPICCDPCKSPPPKPICCDPCKPPPLRPTCCDPCKPPPPRPNCCDPCKPPLPPCDPCKPCGCGKCQPCCAAPIPPCCCACRPPRRAVVKKKCKLMSSKSMNKESDRLSNSSAPRSSSGSTKGKLHETIDGGNNAQTQDVSVEVEGFSVPKRNVVTGMLSNENTISQQSRGPSAFSPNRTPPRSSGAPGSLTSDLREFMADFDNNPTRASAGSPKVPSNQPQSHPFSLAQASRMAGTGGGRANNEPFYNDNNNGNENSDNGRQPGKHWSIG